MSFGKHAIDCLRSDLGFWRDIDDKWVVVYQGMSGSMSSSGIHYLKLTDRMEQGWTAAGIANCTLFETFEEAQAGAELSEYIMKPLSLARIVQLKIKVDVQVEMLEDRPIGTLDALAEI